MKRYAVGIKDGDKVDVIIIKAKSPKDARLRILIMLEEMGAICITHIQDDRTVWTAKPEEKVK